MGWFEKKETYIEDKERKISIPEDEYRKKKREEYERDAVKKRIDREEKERAEDRIYAKEKSEVRGFNTAMSFGGGIFGMSGMPTMKEPRGISLSETKKKQKKQPQQKNMFGGLGYDATSVFRR